MADEGAVGAAAAAAAPAQDMASWTVAFVHAWAVNRVNVSPIAAQVLLDNGVDGSALLATSVAALEGMGMRTGAAAKFINTRNKLTAGEWRWQGGRQLVACAFAGARCSTHAKLDVARTTRCPNWTPLPVRLVVVHRRPNTVVLVDTTRDSGDGHGAIMIRVLSRTLCAMV